MKNAFVVLFVFVPFLSNAQFVRGNKFIGGTLSISAQSSTMDDSGTSQIKTHTFALSPTLGCFLNDKYAVGGGIGFVSTSQKYDYANMTDSFQSRAVSLQAFARRYFMISDKFYFMMTGSVNFSRGNQESNSIKSKYYFVGLKVQPAFVFFPSPRWGIEGGMGTLGFTHNRSLSYDTKYNNFNLDFGGFYLGFAYYILN